MSQTLILASSSIYRQELLTRLQIPFQIASPDVDETALSNESPTDIALRLSELKAKTVASQFPSALIIGSDQVAYSDKKFYGKPGNHERACVQLRELSGNTVDFITGLCVFNAQTNLTTSRAVITQVTFRVLSDETIQRYVEREKPYHCAGSAKSEGLGISLIAKMTCDDPTALIGLPLIALCDLLQSHGMEVI